MGHTHTPFGGDTARARRARRSFTNRSFTNSSRDSGSFPLTVAWAHRWAGVGTSFSAVAMGGGRSVPRWHVGSTATCVASSAEPLSSVFTSERPLLLSLAPESSVCFFATPHSQHLPFIDTTHLVVPRASRSIFKGPEAEWTSTARAVAGEVLNSILVVLDLKHDRLKIVGIYALFVNLRLPSGRSSHHIFCYRYGDQRCYKGRTCTCRTRG